MLLVARVFQMLTDPGGLLKSCKLTEQSWGYKVVRTSLAFLLVFVPKNEQQQGKPSFRIQNKILDTEKTFEKNTAAYLSPNQFQMKAWKQQKVRKPTKNDWKNKTTNITRSNRDKLLINFFGINVHKRQNRSTNLMTVFKSVNNHSERRAYKQKPSFHTYKCYFSCLPRKLVQLRIFSGKTIHFNTKQRPKTAPAWLKSCQT